LQYPGAADLLYLFFIPHNYPTATDYAQGIKMVSLAAERTTPNAKVSNPALRAQADQMIKDQRISEILYVDRNGFITEGSRSNIFLVRDNALFTPALSQVLPGITREMVIEICVKNEIPLHETKIRYLDLETFQGIFITGTSPKVLPVRQIDDKYFAVNSKLLRFTIEEFDHLIREYLKDFTYNCQVSVNRGAF
jgi:branched-chain amino acid aminotransferase